MTEAPGDRAPESPEAVDRCLLQLAVVGAGLTGGGIFLLTDWTLGMTFRIATALCLTAFATGVGGLTKRASPEGPGALIQAKWRWFGASAAFLFAGLTAGLVGTVLR
jgi:hypothetical protein